MIKQYLVGAPRALLLKKMLVLLGFAAAFTAAQPAQATVSTAWHTNCMSASRYEAAKGVSAPAGWVKAECIRVEIHLITGGKIEWDRINATIDADRCQITLTDGSTAVINGREELYVDSADWDNVVRAWYMPKGCPVTVHVRHPQAFYDHDDIYYFKFDSVTTQNDVCYGLLPWKNKQGYCADIPI